MPVDVLAQRSELRMEFDRLVRATFPEVRRVTLQTCRGNKEQAQKLFAEARLQMWRVFPTLTNITEPEFAKRLCRIIISNHRKHRGSDAPPAPVPEVIHPTAPPASPSAIPRAGDWQTAKTMARRLGRTQKWVNYRIGAFADLAEDRIDTNGRPRKHYPPSVFLALKEMSEQTDEVPPAGDWLTEYGLSQTLGRPLTWVRPRLEPHRHLSGNRRARGNRRILPHYPPEVLAALQTELAASKPRRRAQKGQPRYTVAALAKHTGRPESWVQEQLKPFTLLVKVRKTSQGQTVPHYPGELLPLLVELASRPDDQLYAELTAAPDWLSAREISLRVERPEYWVKGRLGHFRRFCGWSRPPGKRPSRRVYPPVVLAVIEIIANPGDLTEDRYTKPRIMAELDRPWHWVHNRLSRWEPEPRRDSSGEVVPTYSQSAFDELKEESEATRRTPPLEDWWTPVMIAAAIGQDLSWVQYRLRRYADIGQRRRLPSGKVRTAYPPEVMAALKAEADDSKLDESA
jgi:hypothetical protein